MQTGLYLPLTPIVFAPVAFSQEAKSPSKQDVDRIVHELGYGEPDEPGLSLIVVQNGKVACKNAYGMADLEAGVKNTTRTNFRLASVTKQFTAMAILILTERGKLSLDDKLTQFFPSFPTYGGQITVRMLLDQTSGITDYGSLIPAGQTKQLSDEDVLDLLEGHPKETFPPGSKFEYSNSNYVLLGLILEKVSGISFPTLLKQNIFEPLGMDHTVAYDQTRKIANRAYGYSAKGGAFERTDQSVTSATLGDGGIYSSVEDMALWDQALYTTRLVSKKTLEEAFTPGPFDARGAGYGFGWFIEDSHGQKTVFHTGGTIGFKTAILRLPGRKFTVVVLMNRSDGRPLDLANRIAGLYYPDLAAIGAVPSDTI